MSGPVKAAVILACAVVALVCLNIAMWRRMKAAVAEGQRREQVRELDRSGE